MTLVFGLDRYSVGKLQKLRSCYNRCIPFFNYQRQDSMTRVLLDLGLYSFDTLLSNSCVIFRSQLHGCKNQLVHNLLFFITTSYVFACLLCLMFMLTLHVSLCHIFIWTLLSAINK